MSQGSFDFTGALDTIDFHGEVLEIVDAKGRAYVPLRRICSNLGIDWNGQHQRIKRDSVLSEGVCVIHTPSPGGAQDTICLPLEYLNGWLFGIDDARVNEAIRPALQRYKREAYAALNAYFNKGFALNHVKLESDANAREAALAELRKLRTNDKALYRKVTDAIAATSVDYADTLARLPKKVASLFARIQDTFHVAASGKTAQEIVIEKADGGKPLAGMIAFSGDPAKITKQDIRTAKNFLEPIPFRKLEILYEQLFLFAEHQIISGGTMTLLKWEAQLTTLLQANGYEPWKLYTSYRAKEADNVAAREFARFRSAQKSLPPAA